MVGGVAVRVVTGLAFFRLARVAGARWSVHITSPYSDLDGASLLALFCDMVS